LEEIITRVTEAAKFAEDYKALDISILDLRGICDFTDAFLICTGTSNVQIRAITKGIDNGMKEKKLGRAVIDGVDSGVWVVMDFGDFVVHVMNQESRDYYRLDSLWGDAKEIEFVSESSSSISHK